ncbi:MAG: monofunctional biosynthetic peptidoglycan transglycosylase [Chitinispirillaceae bacterium]|nr:monofunctional biosynthetic peptidoglycan transglycosylase [Chitinispirillaceae bacterium]
MPRKKRKKTKKRSLLVSIIIVACGLFLLYIGSFFIFPDVAALENKNPETTSFMEYRLRQWKEKGSKKRIDRRWVRYSRIAPCLVKAVIVSEDAKFWRHKGFDLDAIQYAIEHDIKARTFKFGASTITQQLAKNLYLSPSKSPVRKIKEAILTWRIERTLSKRRILELYLNVVEWGDGLFGIEAAVRRYYGISAAELTCEQSARLAAVLPNPIRYNPTSNRRYVVRRSDRIYRILVKRGVVAPIAEENPDSLADDSAATGSSIAAPEMQIDDLIDSLINMDEQGEAWFGDSP